MAQLPDHLTIKKFLNPAGSAIYANAIADKLIQRYNKSISKTISMKVWKDTNGNYIFRVKVPSERNYKYKTPIFYDVILEFYPPKGMEDSNRINEYYIRAFSNCPNFMFNFTYIYNKLGALYKGINQGLYSDEALKDSSTKTNPYRLVGIDKSIFYALRIISEKTGYKKGDIDKIVLDTPIIDNKPVFPGNLFNDISSQIDKLEEVKETPTVAVVKAVTHTKSKNGMTKSLTVGGKTVATKFTIRGGSRNQEDSEDIKEARLINSKLRDKTFSHNMVKSFKSDSSKKSNGLISNMSKSFKR